MLDKYRHSLLPPEMSRKPHAVTRCSVRFLPTCRMAGQSKSRTSSNRTRHGRMRLGSSATASWGIRVIVPESLQAKVLRSLHQNHPGITRMKAIARSYFWWSGLDKAVEALAKSCSSCQVLQAAPAAAPLHPWIWPDAPWKRIHVDFAGPFLGKMFFIVVDAHSKWPEVIVMSSTTTQHTIKSLRSIFSRFGLPEQLVSDNGPQFTSDEFAEFMRGNGIFVLLTIPPLTVLPNASFRPLNEPCVLEERMELLLITVYQNSFSVTVLQLMRQPMYLQVSYSYSGNYASDSICSSPTPRELWSPDKLGRRSTTTSTRNFEVFPSDHPLWSEISDIQTNGFLVSS